MREAAHGRLISGWPIFISEEQRLLCVRPGFGCKPIGAGGL